MSIHHALAPAKVNLGLFIGDRRAKDGRHELVTVMQSISLADEVTLEPVHDPAGPEAAGGGPGGGEDEVLCPGVEGPPEDNLALRALRAFRRSTGWHAPPQRIRIEKRIPVAAGLGGGSADAAAALRLARHASGLGDEELLLELARSLGGDVPAQVTPGCWLASGAGEVLRRLRDPGEAFALLILPGQEGLSTAAVYEEADRLAIARTPQALQAVHGLLEDVWEHGSPVFDRELLQNDLQQPALMLSAGILDGLARARVRGSDWVFLSGSGPTVVGLFSRPGARADRGAGTAGGSGAAGGPGAAGGSGDAGPGGVPGAAIERARAAAESPPRLVPAAIWAHPVGAGFARPWTEGEGSSPPDTPVRHNHGEKLDE